MMADPTPVAGLYGRASGDDEKWTNSRGEPATLADLHTGLRRALQRLDSIEPPDDTERFITVVQYTLAATDFGLAERTEAPNSDIPTAEAARRLLGELLHRTEAKLKSIPASLEVPTAPDSATSEQAEEDMPPSDSMPRISADPSAFRGLHARFKAAQDQYPRQLGFALARVHHEDRAAWDSLKLQGLGDTLASADSRTRAVASAAGADCPECISVDMGEKCRMKYPLDGWRCWLLRGVNMLELPARALDAWHSLATDAARLLELKTAGTIFEGKLIDRKPGGYEHLLRWTVDQLPDEECPRRVWSDPAPGGYTPQNPLMLTRWKPGSPKRWKAEMPCVFAAVARALEHYIRTLEATPPPATSPPSPAAGTEKSEGGRARRHPNRPSQDRQNDIIAAIIAENAPLQREELVRALKLKTEGKLGHQLAWLVENDILTNIPQRGYWPADRPIPQ